MLTPAASADWLFAMSYGYTISNDLSKNNVKIQNGKWCLNLKEQSNLYLS